MHSVVQYSIYNMKGLYGRGLDYEPDFILEQFCHFRHSPALPLCVVAVVGYARVAAILQRASSAVTVSCTISKLA